MPLVKFDSLQNPRERIEKGDWITYPFWRAPDGSTPVAFNVSGLSSKPYRDAVEQASKDLAMKYKGEKVPEEVSYQVDAELIVEHILHDWRGMDVDYTPDLAEQALPDRNREVLLKAVTWCAEDLERVKVQFLEDVEKNSAAPSATG